MKHAKLIFAALATLAIGCESSMVFPPSAALDVKAGTPSTVKDAPDAAVANIPVNYTEAKTGSFTLPDPLTMSDGTRVTGPSMWMNKRRPELLKIFESQYYGRVPDTAPKVKWEVVSVDNKALDGKAIQKNLVAHLGGPDGPTFPVTLYTPVDAKGPVPTLLAINFNFGGGGAGAAAGRGRGATSGPAVARGGRGPASGPTTTVARGRGPGGPQRGGPAELIAHGYGFVNLYYNGIETDTSGAPNINIARKLALRPGQTAPDPDEWGTISSWAWGMSRVVDYLETDPTVDAKHVAIFGVSRLGKTVLWEGVHDQRIALVIASCGGEGGAALARRNYGETIAHLVAPSRYPYQFAENYAKYAKDPNTSPVDSHELVAMMAPRPILLQTGNTDGWSDPKGEFESAVAAEQVFNMMGKKGLGTTEMPPAGQMVGQDLAFYMHDGGHGTVPSDWDVFLKFMDMHFRPTK